MDNVQWKNDRCVEWLLATWTTCVTPERTRAWLARIAPPPLSPDQLDQTIRTLESLSDERFCAWLLETAEPWQQSLLLSTLRRVIRAIEGLTESGPLIEAIALHVRDKDSLRVVLLRMLQAYQLDSALS